MIVAVLQAKRAANRRPSYIKSLSEYLSQFARGRSAAPIASIGVSDIEAWFASRRESASSRASNVGRLSALFSYAVRRGWIQSNPCDRIERVTVDHGVPSVFTPRQAAIALVWTRRRQPDFLAWLVLGLFAGLRPEEADKISWPDIDLERGVLRVDAAASKVRQRRVVDLHSTAVAWLRVAKAAESRLPIPRPTRRRHQRELRDRLRLKAWPKDVLRHTAASYLLALHHDAPKVALWLGNSPAILLRHYRELVSGLDCVRFWRLIP